MPFLQEVLADFVTRQCPLLVFDSGDLRVLDLLQVEPYRLLAQRRGGYSRDQPLDPSQNVGNPALQARRQPSLGPRPVIETWLAMACFAVATRATKCPPRIESHIDLDAAMGDLSREHDPPRLFGDDHHAGRLRPRDQP